MHYQKGWSPHQLPSQSQNKRNQVHKAGLAKNEAKAEATKVREKQRELLIAAEEGENLANREVGVDALVKKLGTRLKNAEAKKNKFENELTNITDELVRKDWQVGKAESDLKEPKESTKPFEIAVVNFEAGKKKYNDLLLELEEVVNTFKGRMSSLATRVSDVPFMEVSDAIQQHHTQESIKFVGDQGRIYQSMDLKTVDGENTRLSMLKDDLERNLKSASDQHAIVRTQFESLKNELAQLTSRETEMKGKIEWWGNEIKKSSAQHVTEIQKLNEILRQSYLQHRRVNSLQAELNRLSESSHNLEKKAIHQKSEILKCTSKVEAIVKDNPWIPDKESSFGQLNGAFDFRLHGVDTASERLDKLRVDKSWNGKAVNTEVLNTLRKNEINLKSSNTIKGEIATFNQKIEDCKREKKPIIEQAFKELCESWRILVLIGAFMVGRHATMVGESYIFLEFSVVLYVLWVPPQLFSMLLRNVRLNQWQRYGILLQSQVISVKALGIALKLTFSGMNQLVYPQTWVFTFIVLLCVITQMNYLNKALDTFNTAVVSPIYYTMFTILTILVRVVSFMLGLCHVFVSHTHTNA